MNNKVNRTMTVSEVARLISRDEEAVAIAASELFPNFNVRKPHRLTAGEAEQIAEHLRDK